MRMSKPHTAEELKQAVENADGQDGAAGGNKDEKFLKAAEKFIEVFSSFMACQERREEDVSGETEEPDERP